MTDSLDTGEGEAQPWMKPDQPAPGEEDAPELTKEEKALGAFLAAMHDCQLDGGRMREAMLNVLGFSRQEQAALPEWEMPDEPGLFKFINETPILQSLLYDINLLPEQIKDQVRWGYLVAVCSHYEMAVINAVPPSPPHECKTEEEKRAFAFGWWKSLEANRAVHGVVPNGWPIIELGQGKVEVAEGRQGDTLALIFGRNGVGEIGAPTQPDRAHLPGETLAIVTFENVKSLDVVAGKLAVLREKLVAAKPQEPNLCICCVSDGKCMKRLALCHAEYVVETWPVRVPS